MAQKVTAMDIRMAVALAAQEGSVAAFCREHQISRQTFYKFRARFDEEGIDGLKDRSRRPLTSPGQTPAKVEDMVVRRRKQLIELGCDHGPQSIVWSLQCDGHTEVPSPSTVWQILTRRGADHATAAETAEVSDQALLLRQAQRVLAVGLDRVVARRRPGGGHRGQPR
jgi:NAD(P)H-dependent flavin oxidoreductase YrpB (nitropropane dioxygenase family)